MVDWANVNRGSYKLQCGFKENVSKECKGWKKNQCNVESLEDTSHTLGNVSLSSKQNFRTNATYKEYFKTLSITSKVDYVSFVVFSILFFAFNCIYFICFWTSHQYVEKAIPYAYGIWIVVILLMFNMFLIEWRHHSYSKGLIRRRRISLKIVTIRLSVVNSISPAYNHYKNHWIWIFLPHQIYLQSQFSNHRICGWLFHGNTLH